LCPICTKVVKDDCNSIFCDFCKCWVHQNHCSKLSLTEFAKLSNSPQSWNCPKCHLDSLPFPLEKSHSGPSGSPEFESLKSLASEINSVAANCINFDIDSVQTSNCRYYDIPSFHTLVKDKNSFYFSALHLNIASMAQHFDEFDSFLAQVNLNFSVIRISETRFLINRDPVLNFNLSGYSCVHTPTKSTAGGALLYLAEHLSFKPRIDLDQILYRPKLLESVFAEINLPKKPNIIVGTIYKHPGMPLDVFNSNHLESFLLKLSKENKQIMLLGNFNINLLNMTEDNNISSFVNNLGSHLILPQVLLPTRIAEHSKTLIDNIFSSLTGHESYSGI